MRSPACRTRWPSSPPLPPPPAVPSTSPGPALTTLSCSSPPPAARWPTEPSASWWPASPTCDRDRKSVVEGKIVSVRVDLGGRRFIKNKKEIHITLRYDTLNNINQHVDYE